MIKQQKKYRWLGENAIEVQGALVFLEGVLEDIDQALPSCGYQRRIFEHAQQSFLDCHDQIRSLVDQFQHKLNNDAAIAAERKML